MGGAIFGCVMMGGGFDCAGGGISPLPHFLGFIDATILKKL